MGVIIQIKQKLIATDTFQILTARIKQFHERRYLRSLLRRDHEEETISAGRAEYAGGGISPYLFSCWWQGEDAMPPMVKECWRRICRYHPDKQVVLITEENVSEYVLFPAYITEKYKSGVISKTAMSDILRAELLYRYGGVWIDATVLIEGRIPDRFYEYELFSGRFPYDRSDPNASKNRWTSWFWVCPYPENELFQYLRTFWHAYWKQADEQIDYFLIDLAIDLGYRTCPQIRRQIDRIPVYGCGKNMYRLMKLLTSGYDEDKFREIYEENRMQKLSWRVEKRIREESPDPDGSFYQVLFSAGKGNEMMHGKEENTGQPDSTLISVIIPVYNAQKYLTACLESVCAQKVYSLQIILVDDGSADDSGRICDRFAARDARITVLHQENRGVSAARNAGLKKAEGTYVSFVDADDILPRDAFSAMLRGMRDTQLVMGSVRFMDLEGNPGKLQKMPDGTIGTDDFLTELFAENRLPYLGFVYGKLFLREIFTKGKICFDPRIRINEDRLFVLKYVLFCRDISMISDPVYDYRRGSGVTARRDEKAGVSDAEMTLPDAFRTMESLCRTHSETLYYLCARKAFECALDLYRMEDRKNPEKTTQILQFLKESRDICMQNPAYTMADKIRLQGHTLLKR